MKPWGPLQWLLQKLPTGPLVVVGCLGAEERSVAVAQCLHEKGVRRLGVLEIRDTPQDAPDEYRERTERKIEANRRKFAAVDVTEEIRLDLLARDEQIVSAFGTLVGDLQGDATVILDISCTPKRFFFLMVKLAIKNRGIRTLIVTYTQAAGAGYTNEQLAGDPEEVRALPGFGPFHSEPEMLVVGLGFEPLGLSQLVGAYRDRRRDIEVLLPFPPGQPYSRRIWKSVDSLGLGGGSKLIHRVSAMDAFQTYSVIRDVAGHGTRKAPPALAPYGPKPMSLGMCLYALKTNAPVFYTQPRFYHPDYTVGSGEIWGYCLKSDGRRTF